MVANESSRTGPASATLNDVLLFNEQLSSVAASGIPIYLGCSPDHVPQTLETMNKSLALAVSRGESIHSALNADATVNDDYRLALSEWVTNGGSLNAADLLYRKGAWRNQMTDQMRLTLLRLGIVWVLASITLLTMVWNLEPKIRGVYDVSGLTPGPAFHWLEMVFNYRWWIGGLFGVITLVGVVDYFRLRKSLFSWMPLRKQVFKFLRNAETAELASCYVHHTAEIPDGLQNELTATPLARWASQYQDSKGGTIQALRFVADYYRDRSLKSNKFSKTVASQLIYLPIGAAVVLTVALMLFMPLVELLIAICGNAFR
jgi:type II secretory pathway component PulF